MSRLDILKRGRLLLPLGLGLLWLLFLLVLAIWSVQSERGHMDAMAEREAKAFFQQIVVTRAWNAAHGGVYVLSTSANPPNKYLDAEDRSIETMQGMLLTKINPAYMTRQVSSIAQADHEVKFHITSLDPIRPENKADGWEAAALKSFEDGKSKERFELVQGKSDAMFRYIAPLYSQQQCMRCHARYGHEGKNILGGISVSFSAAPLIQARKSSVAQTHIAFSMIFFVGFIGICGSTYQIQKKREEAEKANRTKSMFLANMSHDMRTPLNGIMGMTELLQKTGLDKEQGRHADMVRHSAWTLLEIITDITDFSRLESGRLELSRKNFNVRELLADTLDVFNFESKNKGLVLLKEVESTVPKVLYGDAFRLKQIISNLVGNAIKFTHEGSVSIRFYLGAEASDMADSVVRLNVEVEDTGIGIPREEQAFIFESFRQVDGSYAKAHEGSGLGLAICKQLVGMMGGAIQVESEPGRGALFRFEVALSPARGRDDVLLAHGNSGSDSLPTRSCRILVAEDNVLNQTFAKVILEDAGHEVTLASNGLEAIRALRSHCFDIVFMDVQMPQMDGLEAVVRIRRGEAGEKSRAIPIIAATAFATPDDLQQCMNAGMNGCVVKPLASQDLLKAISRYVEVRSIRESHVPTEMKDVVIDVKQALDRLGGRYELYQKLAQTFLEDTPQKVSELKDAVAADNMEEVLRLSHGLKNSAGMVQATVLSDASYALEMAVREERYSDIQVLLEVLEVELSRASEALQAEVEG